MRNNLTVQFCESATLIRVLWEEIQIALQENLQEVVQAGR